MILLKKLHRQNEEKACEIELQKVIHANNESGLDSVRTVLLRTTYGIDSRRQPTRYPGTAIAMPLVLQRGSRSVCGTSFLIMLASKVCRSLYPARSLLSGKDFLAISFPPFGNAWEYEFRHG